MTKEKRLKLGICWWLFVTTCPFVINNIYSPMFVESELIFYGWVKALIIVFLWTGIYLLVQYVD